MLLFLVRIGILVEGWVKILNKMNFVRLLFSLLSLAWLVFLWWRALSEINVAAAVGGRAGRIAACLEP